MQVQGTIKDSHAVFCINSVAKQVRPIAPEVETYRFQLKGLPVRWNREYARHLLTAWGRKHGLTGINVLKTSEKGLTWNGSVLFCVPKVKTA